MLSVTGVGRKEYAEKLGRAGEVPSVPCPDAACDGQKQGGHGFYRRYVDGKLFDVRRLICGLCGVSNAVLPDDLCAYRDVSLLAVEAAADAWPGPAAAARAAGVTGTEAKRRVRRLVLTAGSLWVSQILALLAAGPERWMDVVRAVVGAGGGGLVRLRSWMWSRYRVYLGGPCGLFRLGRPCGRPGAATHTGW
jgi:hypothetical protein